ncbi:hemolysin family protein [Cytobacillus purgationiresistens]|uniref:Mg2+/Co2+ transporter CorB n=1 Tax=Cytobacillus purgationiresistens TaxID=863449 RepID=A0ABU0ANW6_9BACI|nr:CNNM domain-containing protein [Cytobacillus purgationiresistens]MDQ0272986.1 Mg2+/Co2+ transporter CorB [Cytobacillus purgationiresistens]
MIIAIIFLLFVSFFFSGSETALTATNKMRLRTKANNHDIKAEKLLNLVSKPSEFITSILIGNNIANILLPTLVTTLAISYGFNVALASTILTVVIIIFSEVIPKSIAAAFPDRISYLVYPVIRFIIIVLKPITVVLNGLTGFITSVLSKGKKQEMSLSKEELRAMVDIADSEGVFKQEESHRIKGALNFHNLNVKDILKTPRMEIVSFPITTTFEEVRDIVIQNPFTRYPVYRKDIDSIVAVFHSKYLISWSTEPSKSLESYCDTDPLVIYEFSSLEWVFRQMTKEKKHIAIVLDEYGGTEGIVTHEDIIEAMIGLEIEDEMDLENERLINKLTENEIICNGKITLYQLNSIFHTNLPEEDDVLAGYILKELNHFPREGEVIERNNLTFKILEVKGRTLKKIQITKWGPTI